MLHYYSRTDDNWLVTEILPQLDLLSLNFIVQRFTTPPFLGQTTC